MFEYHKMSIKFQSYKFTIDTTGQLAIKKVGHENATEESDAFNKSSLHIWLAQLVPDRV